MKQNSYSFQRDVTNVINNQSLLQEGDGVIVAVSGGSDSICLLTVLSRLTFTLNLRVVYVDHNLRPEETPIEIKLIKQLCTDLGIPFTVKSIDVKRLAKENKISIEEAARHLRYQALEEERRSYSFTKIAVGHNADDQVEEFFIRLIRGSGSTGLAGMRAIKGAIIRPLLFETKKRIEQYLTGEGIIWSTDSSNFQLNFLRNKIRHSLIPDVERNYNPRIRHGVRQTMSVLQEEDDYLTHISEHQYSYCVDEVFKDASMSKAFSIFLDNTKYLSCHLAVRRRVVEKICWKMHSRPSFINIDDIDNFVLTAGNGKELHLSDGLRVTKQQQRVYFSHPPLKKDNRGSIKEPALYEIVVEKSGCYSVPGTNVVIDISESAPDNDAHPELLALKIDVDMVTFPLIIRGGRAGERFTPYKGVGSKKVSRYFNDQKLDKHKRSSWPILFSGNSLVAIVGFTIAHQFRITDKTKRILYISYQSLE